MTFTDRLICAACLLVIPTLSMARTPYGMAGCGLGSMLFSPNGGQVSAATTNGSTFNQGFGITSGTSNCIEPSKAMALSSQQHFIAHNYSNLSKEIAQGDGETLKAFADTFGCNNAVYPTFAQHMQQSYNKIFAAPGALAALDVVSGEIKNRKDLSSQCGLVI